MTPIEESVYYKSFKTAYENYRKDKKIEELCIATLSLGQLRYYWQFRRATAAILKVITGRTE
jgi:hypothetical protein